MGLKTLSVAGLLLKVSGILALFYSRSLFGGGPATIAVQALAVVLLIWARLTFGHRSFHAAATPTSGGLVTTGPYRYLRHPIYASILWFVAAGVAAHPSALSVLFGLAIAAGAAMRIFAEERLVVQRYPEYAAYAARIPRVIPFLF